MSCQGVAALSPCDLAGIIDTVTSAFPDTGTLYKRDWSASDGYGGTTVQTTSTIDTPCRVQAKIGDLAKDADASGLMVQEFNVFVPPTLAVSPKDEFLYKGVLMQVQGIAAPQTEQTFIEFMGVRVG